MRSWCWVKVTAEEPYHGSPLIRQWLIEMLRLSFSVTPEWIRKILSEDKDKENN